MTRKTALHAAFAALLAAPAGAQPSFTKYVAVGDSLTAGFTNGSLVLTHQASSWPLLLARHRGRVEAMILKPDDIEAAADVFPLFYEDVKSRHVILVANLKPRKMRFGVSEGMVLAASDDEGGPFMLSPDNGAKAGMKVSIAWDTKNGSKIAERVKIVK